jgi:membrane protease YdiL (CAAX protease family)
VSGLAVALIEETFLRGALQTGITRESGAPLAIVLTSLLYAATHFIGRMRIAPADVDAWSGVELIRGTLAAFAEPLAIGDAFICLALVGALLGLVRARTGNIAACIGLHAGWVWVITFVRETSQPDPAQPLAFLLSNFDGVVGWLVAAWTLVIGVALHALYARRTSGVGTLHHR